MRSEGTGCRGWADELGQDGDLVWGEAEVGKLVGTVVRHAVTAGEPVTQGALVAPGVAGLGPSIDVARKAGRAFGSARFNKKRVDRAMGHIEQAMPGLDAPARHELAVRSYEHLFELGVEMTSCSRTISEDAWPHHMRLGDIKEAIETVARCPDGLLIFFISFLYLILLFGLARKLSIAVHIAHLVVRALLLRFDRLFFVAECLL